MLRLKRAEIGQAMAEQQAQLTRVENRLRLIEREGTMPDQEIVLKELEPIHVIYLREILEGVDRIPAMIQDGYIGLISNGVTPTAPAFSIYHDPEFKPESFDHEVAYPVPEGTPPLETPAGRKFSERVVAGGKHAILVHQGPLRRDGRSLWADRAVDHRQRHADRRPSPGGVFDRTRRPRRPDHRDPLAGAITAA